MTNSAEPFRRSNLRTSLEALKGDDSQGVHRPDTDAKDYERALNRLVAARWALVAVSWLTVQVESLGLIL